MKTNHDKKTISLGEFIKAAYDVWGKRKGKGAVRLAIKMHLIQNQ